MDFRALATVAAAALFCTHPSAAAAQDSNYVAGSIGYAVADDFETDVGVEASIKNGYALTGALGRSFGALRGEIEGSYRRSKVDQARALGVVVEGKGEVSALSAMANIYFNPALELGPVRPYIGGGVGVSRFRARDVEAVGVPGVPPLSGTETGFAWQLMAGVGLPLSDQTTLSAGYRYFATPDVKANVASLGSVEVDGLGLHVGEIGLRFRF